MSKSEIVMRAQRRKKEIAVERMGGKCQLCGYNKCINSLVFHHINPDKKAAAPTYLVMRASWERALEELKKCVLLCANCHGEVHFKEMNVELQRHIAPWVSFQCPVCLIVIETQKTDQKYCSNKCRAFDDRKVERPTKDELQKLMEDTSWLQMGKMFGVSDNSVRKWAKSYGLLV